MNKTLTYLVSTQKMHMGRIISMALRAGLASLPNEVLLELVGKDRRAEFTRLREIFDHATDLFVE